MEHVYVHGRCALGVYDVADLGHVARLLDRDERDNADSGRLSLFQRYVATPLPSGVVAVVLEDTPEAALLRILADGPPKPLWVPRRFVMSIPAYVAMMASRWTVTPGSLPHERLLPKAKLDPPEPKPQKNARRLLSLDDAMPEWARLFDDEPQRKAV